MNDWIACFKKDETPIINEYGNCRFPNDHLNVDTELFTVVVDGLILNKKELFEQYHSDDLLSLALQMHRSKQKDFFNDFRGPFTGLFYDKPTRQAVVFTNQTGDSAVFYHCSDAFQVFSSNYLLLLNFLKENAVKVHFDEKAAHWMLSFGFLIDDATFVQEIKQLNAGKALYLEEGKWIERRYHQFETKSMPITEDEAVKRMDTLFRRAVKRCFDKDLEYGYSEHLVDMSAGMDSRMVNYVAKAMGYTGITNISYSQIGSEEERYSKAASASLGNAMIFEALDDHQFIYDIDSLVRGNFGTYLYTGITGGARLLSKIDYSRFGAEQTGQLGDAIVGGSLLKGTGAHVDVESMRLSHILPLRFDPNAEHIENQEIYGLYTRGFKGAMSSWFIRKQFTFALSPFTDVDFMEFCYSLPTTMRKNHHLYWKWVERYYPEALEVPTTRKKMPITLSQRGLDFADRAFHKGLKVGRRVLFKLGLVKSRVRSDSSMNPYEYWYDTDPTMRQFFDDYYREHFMLFDVGTTLKDEVNTLYNSSSVLDKLMALTVLAAYFDLR